MRPLKSNENTHKKEGGPHHAFSANKAPPATPQSPGNESQRKHRNPANPKQAADSKTDTNQNGAQTNKNPSRTRAQTNHLFLISQNIIADLKGPK